MSSLVSQFSGGFRKDKKGRESLIWTFNSTTRRYDFGVNKFG